MITLLLLLACVPDAYEDGYSFGCDFTTELGYVQGLADGEACIVSEASILCASPDSGEAGHGWEDGCYTCMTEAYTEGQQDGSVDCEDLNR